MPDQEQRVEILQPQTQNLKSELETSLLLSDLPTGARGVVRQLRGGREFTGRLAALGFTLGAELEVIQNSGGGAIIVAVRNTHVALGRGEAVKVQVQILADESQLAAPPNSIKVALVGEPNVGKSTVFNTFGCPTNATLIESCSAMGWV